MQPRRNPLGPWKDELAGGERRQVLGERRQGVIVWIGECLGEYRRTDPFAGQEQVHRDIGDCPQHRRSTQEELVTRSQLRCQNRQADEGGADQDEFRPDQWSGRGRQIQPPPTMLDILQGDQGKREIQDARARLHPEKRCEQARRAQRQYEDGPTGRQQAAQQQDCERDGGDTHRLKAKHQPTCGQQNGGNGGQISPGKRSHRGVVITDVEFERAMGHQVVNGARRDVGVLLYVMR